MDDRQRPVGPATDSIRFDTGTGTPPVLGGGQEGCVSERACLWPVVRGCLRRSIEVLPKGPSDASVSKRPEARAVTRRV